MVNFSKIFNVFKNYRKNLSFQMVSLIGFTQVFLIKFLFKDIYFYSFSTIPTNNTILNI